MSAYGGVIACNSKVTLEMAESVRPIFTEVIVAPDYEPAALELLQTKKKNLRILEVAEPPKGHTQFRQIDGGLLVQDMDSSMPPATIRTHGSSWPANPPMRPRSRTSCSPGAPSAASSPTPSCSRTISHGRIGMGQVNRVDSCHLAVDRANTLADGAIAHRFGRRVRRVLPVRRWRRDADERRCKGHRAARRIHP